MTYLLVFFCALAVDLIPLVAPPAWTVMVFLLVKFDLKPWIVVLAGVPGSTLGRYLYSLYVVKLSEKLIERQKHEDLKFLGKKLSQKLWPSWLFVFLYTLTPLSTTPLFTAAGVAKMNPGRIIPPFFCGKFVSDAVMIFAGRYAAGNLKNVLHGAFSLKGISVIASGLVLLGGLLFIDWRSLLEGKKFKFNFRIWK